jgi:chloramphenicol-sensitive protein RarD
MFAFLPWYTHQFPINESSGNWLGAQRILWSSALMLLGMFACKQLPLVVQQLRAWRAWPRLYLAALLVGLQLWLFIWAPVNGYTLSVALGYFALPLVLVLIGRFVYQERLSRLQWLAVVLAALGVAYAYLLADGLSWVVLVIALGYPLYFMLRRKYPLPSQVSFTLDNLLLLPIALAYLCLNDSGVTTEGLSDSWYALAPNLYYLGLGIAGTVPMLLFLFASNYLPMTLFGLLVYLEPMLVFGVGWLLGERLAEGQWPTYAFIVLALAVLALDGVLSFVRQKARGYVS